MAEKWGAEKWLSPQAFRHFFAPIFLPISFGCGGSPGQAIRG
jgi:hypothetical protein